MIRSALGRHTLVAGFAWLGLASVAMGQGAGRTLPAGNPLSRPSIPTSPAPATTPAPADAKFLKTGQAVPEPTAFDQLEHGKVALPNVPLEPYLLTTQAGPFMVCAYVFRGPEATQYALALAHELRTANRLKAYVYHLKIHPMNSNIQGEYPTKAAAGTGAGDTSEPLAEKYRMYDEAAVLVGDAKTIDDSEDILKVVKKLKPACLENMPSIYAWRHGTGLKRAFLTTNPLIPAQYLYPGPRTVPAGMAHAPHGAKPGEKFDPFVAAASLMQRRPADKFVRSLNKGNRSLYKNPGPYTLQVAEFVGRQSLDTNNNKESVFDLGLKNSPLRTAHEDAEKLADSIAKCQSAAGLQPYVYHDRTSSKVFLGSFAGPHDPNLKRCIDVLPKVSNELLQRGFTQLLLSPATMLSEIPED